jgi:hypothetical protein
MGGGWLLSAVGPSDGRQRACATCVLAAERTGIAGGVNALSYDGDIVLPKNNNMDCLCSRCWSTSTLFALSG